MGTSQSTHAASEIKELPPKLEAPPSSVSGRKQSNEDRLEDANVISEPNAVISSDDDSTESDYEFDSSDDEEGKIPAIKMRIISWFSPPLLSTRRRVERAHPYFGRCQEPQEVCFLLYAS